MAFLAAAGHFGDKYNQPIDRVNCPTSLKELDLGVTLGWMNIFQRLEEIKLTDPFPCSVV